MLPSFNRTEPDEDSVVLFLHKKLGPGFLGLTSAYIQFYHLAKGERDFFPCVKIVWRRFQRFVFIAFTKPRHPEYCTRDCSCVRAFFAILCMGTHHARNICIVAAVHALRD